MTRRQWMPVTEAWGEMSWGFHGGRWLDAEPRPDVQIDAPEHAAADDIDLLEPRRVRVARARHKEAVEALQRATKAKATPAFVEAMERRLEHARRALVAACDAEVGQ